MKKNWNEPLCKIMTANELFLTIKAYAYSWEDICNEDVLR